MGSQLYRCFACDGDPFRALEGIPSCSKCDSPDAVARIVEIHMISEVKGGPINNKYKPLCCNVYPPYFTNSKGGVTCPICLGIIRKAEVKEEEETEETEEVEKVPDQAVPKQVPVEPESIQEPAESESVQKLVNEYYSESLDLEEDNPPCREC